MITPLMSQEREAKGHVNLTAFYSRRFFRIVPLYALTIALYGLILLALQHDGGGAAPACYPLAHGISPLAAVVSLVVVRPCL